MHSSGWIKNTFHLQCIAGCNNAVFTTLKTLGVQLESLLTFINHVNDIARVCKLHLRALHHIRPFLPRYVANIICLQYHRRMHRLLRCTQQITARLKHLARSCETIMPLSYYENFTGCRWEPHNLQSCNVMLQGQQLGELANLKFLLHPYPYVPACMLHSSDRDLFELLASRTKAMVLVR